MGIDVEEVSHLLVTHAQFDHASHAARLRRHGVQVVANREGGEALVKGDDRCVGYAVHGVFEPCTVDRVVSDGERLAIGGVEIRCLEAPGHADSCVIYEVHLRAERLWFGGDVINVGVECQSVELGWNGGPDYRRATYVETLRRLAKLPCDHLFPGHGPACIGDGHRLVDMAYTLAMMELRWRVRRVSVTPFEVSDVDSHYEIVWRWI